MVRFTLKSDGIKSNVNELILSGNLSNDDLVAMVMYQFRLSRWWKYKYNSDQPIQIINII